MSLAYEIFWKMNNLDANGLQKDNGCDFCRDFVRVPETFSIMTHEGKQSVVTFNFCPVCGRKL